ncbi:MAG: CehA/McbA family metallohydrolase [Armatimonadota bacterium]|nr:CehA/McbA family metallohydrolase [Armatimonadota bacterium]MDW8155853.1 CehA/McbA family metallohydrolase [Armatimonadota bacterium]
MRILDPYAVPGEDRRAQLHVHTTASDGQYTPQAVAERYRSRGFSFLALTDHNVVACTEGLSDAEFCVVPGVEVTVPAPFRPLGPHLGCLLVRSVPGGRDPQRLVDQVAQQGGLAGLNHPSWGGNLWTARWSPQRTRRLRGVRFVEVWNPHSDPDEDTRRWVEVVRLNGPGHVVFPVASDDFHRDGQLGHGWVVVRTEKVTEDALREALERGSVYATTGPQAHFGVRAGCVVVESDATRVCFYDGHGQLKAAFATGAGEYEPSPGDTFVYAECLGRGAGRAWSAPFWILPEKR